MILRIHGSTGGHETEHLDIAASRAEPSPWNVGTHLQFTAITDLCD
jgi:hypothetical protein